MIYEFLGLIALLLLSGFFSSSELAFVVANKIKIELRARKNKLAAKNAQYFIERPQVFFSTILISNNIVNIAFASVMTVFLVSVFNYSDWTILIISTLVLLMFGELIPKYFAREIPDTLILISSIPLRIITFTIYPLVKIISSISSFLTRSANLNEENISQLFEKDDIQTLLDESSSVGKIDENETDIINKIIDLGEQKVYEAMTPRTDIVGIEVSTTIQDTIKTLIDSGYSKLPVFEESIDNIKGFVHVYDMFQSPENLSAVLREITFVPDSKKTLELLNELLEKQTSLAIVVDEFGGTAGLITLEDIIEEMLGEIRDEYDVEEHICKRIDPFTYVISGKVEIDHINEEFELNIPEGEYETIAGFISSGIGMIPEQGQTYLIDNFKILILRADKRRVELVKLQVITSK